METPGQGKRAVPLSEIVQILSQQQKQIKFLTGRVKELEEQLLQEQMRNAVVNE